MYCNGTGCRFQRIKETYNGTIMALAPIYSRLLTVLYFSLELKGACRQSQEIWTQAQKDETKGAGGGEWAKLRASLVFILSILQPHPCTLVQCTHIYGIQDLCVEKKGEAVNSLAPILFIVTYLYFFLVKLLPQAGPNAVTNAVTNTTRSSGLPWQSQNIAHEAWFLCPNWWL